MVVPLESLITKSPIMEFSSTVLSFIKNVSIKFGYFAVNNIVLVLIGVVCVITASSLHRTN